MGVDTKRFTGPTDSVDYKLYTHTHTDKQPTRKSRSNAEQRKVYLQTGVISQAKGSAYLELGNTKVMVGVYGPREIPKRSDFSMKGLLSCEFKFAPFACKTRRGHQADAEEIELSLLLKECLESTVRMNLYPKSCIDVFVTVLEDDGGVLAAAITATGLALSDAQIGLYDNITGANVSIRGNETLVDPTLAELATDTGVEGQGNITVGYLNTSEQVVCLVSQGVLTPQQFNQRLDIAIKQCGVLVPAVQQSQLESFQKKQDTENQS
jgi:exosome complex component MTR3